ncbi:unnamed protein product [Cochlearia groenlandica]
MTTMSDLTKDLVEKILSKVPITCLKKVRSTCKKWDALSKKRIFGKSTKDEFFLGFMMMDYRVCSLRYNLQGDFVDPSIKQVSILNQIEVSKIYHCDGLLLCVLKDMSSLFVWNPYLGQTRWIQPRNKFHRLDTYALGYDDDDNMNRNHKILRFIDEFLYVENLVFGYEIYDFTSDSWRVLDVTPDWDIDFYQRGVTLKGNAYFFAKQKLMSEGFGDDEDIDTTETEDFLLCFDFTAERFGQRLPLPFHSYFEETVTMSCVGDDRLAILYQRNAENIEIMEIWVTDKISPVAVSWSMFLKVNMRPLTGFKFVLEAGSFFIDEEKKVAVVFDLDGHKHTTRCRYQTAHIIGHGGYYKSVNIAEAPNLEKPGIFGYNCPIYCMPLLCSSSYVPNWSVLATTARPCKKPDSPLSETGTCKGTEDQPKLCGGVDADPIQ